MKLHIRILLAVATVACLVAASAYRKTAEAAQTQEAPEKKAEEQAGHGSAHKATVPQGESQTAKEKFNQKLGTPRELSGGEKFNPPPPRVTDLSGGAKATGKVDHPGSAPPEDSTLEERIQNQTDVKETAGKSKRFQEHSRQEGHHLPPHKPDDPCAKAGSPEKVENCKKAGEAWEHSK